MTMRRCRRLQNFSVGRNSPSEGWKIFLSRSVIDFDLPSARTDAVEVKGGDFHVQGLSENELWVFFLKYLCCVLGLSQLLLPSEEATPAALGQNVIDNVTGNAAFPASSLVQILLSPKITWAAQK